MEFKELMEKFYNLEKQVNNLTEQINKPAIINFAKVRPDAIMPNKRKEDAGYDLYANVDADVIIIEPHTTTLVPTGIASAFSSDYVLKLWERGSTGTKGMGQRSGVIDSGYRGEIKAPITNHNDKPIMICKFNKDNIPEVVKVFYSEENIVEKFSDELPINSCVFYPYTKAITQGTLIYTGDSVVEEISYDELKAIPSERGTGLLGSSNK